MPVHELSIDTHTTDLCLCNPLILALVIITIYGNTCSLYGYGPGLSIMTTKLYPSDIAIEYNTLKLILIVPNYLKDGSFSVQPPDAFHRDATRWTI